MLMFLLNMGFHFDLDSLVNWTLIFCKVKRFHGGDFVYSHNDISKRMFCGFSALKHFWRMNNFVCDYDELSTEALLYHCTNIHYKYSEWISIFPSFYYWISFSACEQANNSARSWARSFNRIKVPVNISSIYSFIIEAFSSHMRHIWFHWTIKSSFESVCHALISWWMICHRK